MTYRIGRLGGGGGGRKSSRAIGAALLSESDMTRLTFAPARPSFAYGQRVFNTALTSPFAGWEVICAFPAPGAFFMPFEVDTETGITIRPLSGPAVGEIVPVAPIVIPVRLLPVTRTLTSTTYPSDFGYFRTSSTCTMRGVVGFTALRDLSTGCSAFCAV